MLQGPSPGDGAKFDCRWIKTWSAFAKKWEEHFLQSMVSIMAFSPHPQVDKTVTDDISAVNEG
jgi:hypothetical protein